jgi:uncharacterized protein YbjT (DUF2867 family)
MKTLCITGATGNVGIETLRFLIAAQQQNPEIRIIAAVQRADSAKKLLESKGLSGLEYRELDMMNPDSAESNGVFKDVEYLFLMRPPQISDVPKYIQPIVQAAERAGVRHVVFLSLNGVEEQTRTPHYAIEQVLRATSMKWTFLRPSFFMQNLTTTHREEIARRNEIFVSAGDGKTNFIDVQDIGEAAARVLLEAEKHSNAAYSLTGSTSYTYPEIAALLTKELGRRIVYANPSKLHFFLRKWLQERIPLMFVLVMIYLYHQTINGKADSYSPDLEWLLGHPPTSIEDFLERNKQTWV